MITQIGDAIVTKINASGLLSSFSATAVRKIIPRIGLPDSASLQVQVITPRIDRRRQNRAAFRNDHIVQIGILQLLDSGNDEPPQPAAVDPLIALAESLLNLKFSDVTNSGRTAEWLKTESNPLYDADALELRHQFVSVQTVTFVEFQE